MGECQEGEKVEEKEGAEGSTSGPQFILHPTLPVVQTIEPIVSGAEKYQWGMLPVRQAQVGVQRGEGALCTTPQPLHWDLWLQRI